MAEEVASSAAAAVRSGKTAKELENTVLLGRGKSHLNHPGNRYFQGKPLHLHHLTLIEFEYLYI